VNKFIDIASLRVEYSTKRFNPEDANPNPYKQFDEWLKEAVYADVPEPNAMTLATITEANTPSARIVLLKGLDERGFTFFTNYNSAKGLAIKKNPHVALVFCWLELQRQVRIEGIAEKLPAAESDAYFSARPYGSQIGAHASPQSSVIANSTVLEQQFEYFTKKYPEGKVPRPENWGGYLVKPQLIEFWQGRASRMHDRLQYTQRDGRWLIQLLAP
jgi:pyridoxamine 5'-phosphate oxidase